MERKGPGLLLRDIQRGKDGQINAVIANIVALRPDVLAIQRFDWDAGGWALTAFQTALADVGANYPHVFAPRPNSGVPSGVDVDGDGKINLPWDAMGFGYYPGNRGLAVLSKFPLDHDAVTDLTQSLWRDAPKSRSKDAPALAAVQRLSSVAHISIPIQIRNTQIDFITTHTTAPVFDGPEDRNGRRNADEVRLISILVDRATTPIVAANLNLDSADGEGLRDEIRTLLSHPALQDTKPSSAGGKAAADPDQTGDPALDTADWPDNRPGNLRVSYVLPASNLTVIGSGVQWPVGMDTTAGPHKIVWVDIDIP